MTKSSTLFGWGFYIIFIGALIASIFWITDILWGSDVISNFPQTLEYYPAFIATAMGVFFALVLQEALTLSKQEKRMDEMQKILRKELQRMQDLVSERKGNHLDTQVWDSLINSGDVSLLPTELQDELFEVYAKARAMNIEANRARDAAEAYRRQPTEDTEKAHKELSIRISEKEVELGNTLHIFLNSKKLRST
ncbi:MAG: hypothetical protein ACFFE6_13500 [Candidatus Thorarchaeota archaeon]